MAKVSLRLHNTVYKRDKDYARYVNDNIDNTNIHCMLYSDIYNIVTSEIFETYYRSNTEKRRNMFLSKKAGIDETLIMLYDKILLKRKDTTVIDKLNLPYFSQNKLKPLLKWPGGKTEDLNYIKNNLSFLLPLQIENYYEPFVGGGAAWLSVTANKMYVNDLCQELIVFYEMIRDQNHVFFDYIESITQNWELLASIAQKETDKLYNIQSIEEIKEIMLPYQKELEDTFFAHQYKHKYFNTLVQNLNNKIQNIRKVESKRNKLPHEDVPKNIECALKSGFYTTIRNIYNKHEQLDELRISCFYFLRDYCFSSMFRYNSNGEFNVPYGGISYNDKLPNYRLNYWRSQEIIKHLQATDFSKVDFYNFFQEHNLGENDFIFVDPPYDSNFSTYAGNSFGTKDQKRLADYLINHCKSKFMAIMKNTEFIRSLYENKPNIRCLYFNKNYSASFKDRNDRAVEHIVVVRV